MSMPTTERKVSKGNSVVSTGSATSNTSGSGGSGANSRDSSYNERADRAMPRSESAIRRRRAAIKRKKVEEIRGHMFAKVYFKGFTFCSHCSNFIWGVTSPQGYRCQNCNKAVHKRCRKDVLDVCTKSQVGGYSVMVQEKFNINMPHRLENVVIRSPTFCDHCGNINGLFSNASRCKECKMCYHKKCTPLIGNTCGLDQKMMTEALKQSKDKRDSTKSSASTTSSTSDVSQPPTPLSPESMQHPFAGDPRASTTSLESVFEDMAVTQGRKKYGPSDFSFISVLGKGSFGKVLLAQSTSDGSQYYAVKAMRKDIALDDDDVETAQMERKVLALGTESPFLTNLLCTFQSKTHLFFVMEFLNGGDLLYHIQKVGTFNVDRTRFYVAEVLSGLQFLHKRKVIYRDLKLDNILLDKDGHIKIADFGMCKKLISEKDKTSTFCGTPDYIAPEIILQKKYGNSVDYWSLGVLTFEMMTGESPFVGGTDDELFDAILKAEIFIPKYLEKESRAFIKELLTREPLHRLGCSSGSNPRQHPFFRPIDWQKLETRQMQPPFRPKLGSAKDTSNFDYDFTAEKVCLTPIKKDVLKQIDQDLFRDFSFTNQELIKYERKMSTASMTSPYERKTSTASMTSQNERKTSTASQSSQNERKVSTASMASQNERKISTASLSSQRN